MAPAFSSSSPVPVAPGTPPTPREFGRYTLLERLGSGGMAEVHLAAMSGAFETKKLVVLKRPHAPTEQIGKMFLDEARLAMRLNHPNVVQTYDVGQHEGFFFLAMEYLDGQALQRFMAAMVREDRHLSHLYLARIASDALSGLDYAHELRDYDGTPLSIVHRDVSPHNLFITYDGQVKVVDFGVAKATSNLAQTEAGAVKGKLSYMAPEQALEQGVDRRADVFAMGIVLWEMIARQRLLTGVTSGQVLNRLLHLEFPRLSKVAPAVDPMLEDVVMRALERDITKRFQSAAEMREALEEFIAESGTNVRHAEIGRFVGELFQRERAEMAAKIKSHMATLGRGSGSGLVTPSVPPPAVVPATTGPHPYEPAATRVAPLTVPPSAPSGASGPFVAAAGSSAERRGVPIGLIVAMIAGFLIVIVGSVMMVVRSRARMAERAATTGEVFSAAPSAVVPPPVTTAAPSAAPVPTPTVSSVVASPTGTGAGTATGTGTKSTRPRGGRGSGGGARPIDTSFPGP